MLADAGPRRRQRARRRLGRRQPPLHRPEHEVMHLPAVAKADFELLRMRIDVDQRRIDVQVQHVRRLSARIQHVAKAQPHGIHEQAVAHRAAVDEPELQVRGGARRRRRADPAGDAHRPGGMVQLQRLRGEFAARRCAPAGRRSRHCRPSTSAPVRLTKYASRCAAGTRRRCATARAAPAAARCGPAR